MKKTSLLTILTFSICLPAPQQKPTFWQNIISLLKINVAMTESTISNSRPVSSCDGYTMLPSGMIMKFGTATITLPGQGSKGEKSINFSEAFPNACFKVFITLHDNAVDAGLITGIKITKGITPSNFIVSYYQTKPDIEHTFANFTYLAIGY